MNLQARKCEDWKGEGKGEIKGRIVRIITEKRKSESSERKSETYLYSISSLFRLLLSPFFIG